MHNFTPEIEEIVSFVQSECASHGSDTPMSILIDGPSGSGKTTLAKELYDRLGTHQPALVHMDDLYLGWNGLNAGIARASLELLEPHGLGLPATFQAYNWQKGTLGSDISVADKRMLILEGCGSFGAAIEGDAYVRMWISADDAVRKERALSRGGENYEEYWQMWEDQFIDYVRSFAAPTQASLVVRASE